MSMMNQEGDGRTSLADLPPELLNLIFSKLPSVHRFKVGDELGRPKRELRSSIPEEMRKRLSKSTIIYKFRQNGWLLCYSESGYFMNCCFNPLLSWPACFIRLPDLYGPTADLPIAAAFSASPTDYSSGDDLRLLLFHYGDRINDVRIRRQQEEEEDLPPVHERYYVSDLIDRHPVAADYIETKEGGKFFVLFESGDVLIWGTEEGGVRKMLIAKPPRPSVKKETNGLLIAVGESLVMTWSAGSSASEDGTRAFQLVSVEETRSENDDRELEEGGLGGGTTTRYLVGEDANVKIRKYSLLCDIIIRVCMGLFTLLFLGIFVGLLVRFAPDEPQRPLP